VAPLNFAPGAKFAIADCLVVAEITSCTVPVIRGTVQAYGSLADDWKHWTKRFQ